VTAQQQQLTQPPSLPPHLEKVMLNSQTVSDEDNSVLPVPNHVTLNHLYACSIKDGVMALAATSRYRKKVSVSIDNFVNSEYDAHPTTLSLPVCYNHVL
jgi:hypothetical protein